MTCVAKPWGNYEVLKVDDGFQVKRIEVNVGHRLSYQSHDQRAEKWVVVHGEGVVVLDQKEIKVKTGSYVDIPIKSQHRIQNTGDKSLVFIEVQLGSYLGEDDIIRYEDDYNRAKHHP